MSRANSGDSLDVNVEDLLGLTSSSSTSSRSSPPTTTTTPASESAAGKLTILAIQEDRERERAHQERQQLSLGIRRRHSSVMMPEETELGYLGKMEASFLRPGEPPDVSERQAQAMVEDGKQAVKWWMANKEQRQKESTKELSHVRKLMESRRSSMLQSFDQPRKERADMCQGLEW